MTHIPKQRRSRFGPGEPPKRPITLSPITLALILLVLVVGLFAIWAALHWRPGSPLALPGATWPNRALTPGAVDKTVTGDAICAHDWAPGDPPEPGDGDLTYSKAARHTSAGLKDAVFAEYNLTNPHDGGQSYEVDHFVPLSLGGRDVRENLWPESRTGDGMNAWAKDRLEYRLFRLVCDPPPGTPHMALGEAQAAFTPDWVAGYHKYCADDADCPAFGGE
jgi:hypothetical protein